MTTRDREAQLQGQAADAARRAVEAWRRRGLEGTVKLGSSKVPAVMPVTVLSVEFLVRAWDFARATGRDVVVSEPVSDCVPGLARNVTAPQAGGSAGFADPVEAGSDAGVPGSAHRVTGR